MLPETIALQVQIPVDAIVTALLAKMLNASAQVAAQIAHAPRIGAEWPEQGGIYAGTVRGDTDEPDYHLIVSNSCVSDRNWKDAMDWAKHLSELGHADFDLPKRKEQAILYGNVPELFEKYWYWSNTQYAADSDFAWMQDFSYGHQYTDRKSNEYRARAVRRLIIQ